MNIRQSVNIIIQNGEGKYLLQMRDGTDGICNPLRWNFFGGKLEEADVRAAAAREMLEEIGVTVESDLFEIVGKLQRDDGKVVHVVRFGEPLEWQDIVVQEGAGAGYFYKEELLRIPITAATQEIAERLL